MSFVTKDCGANKLKHRKMKSQEQLTLEYWFWINSLYLPLELSSNLIAFFLATIFYGQLDNTASIMFEDNVSHPTTGSSGISGVQPLGCFSVWQATKRFGVDEKCRVRFGSTKLFL
jgi:hypothetical protein